MRMIIVFVIDSLHDEFMKRASERFFMVFGFDSCRLIAVFGIYFVEYDEL